ncbi:beta-N-acetylhexosaminidase family protein [Rhodobacter ferrooxidans]|uniref:STAS domain-containing protein n=1 Tax=Rhodobacter ferrooxidans TaxID=371731 RepID=C8S3Z8_9RHOB|nr:hypothetical protein [Rhodobacter sp. SW2]EEW24260.1 hypothetical protein Rsw2DRAFT_2776 [Rhodobacter sp. SW2]
MSYSLTILPEKRLALFQFVGEMNVANCRQSFVEYVKHELFRSEYVMLVDTRGVTVAQATFSEIFAAVQSVSSLLRKFDTEALSVVLVRDDVQFGLARVLEQVLDFSSRIRMRVVYTEAEALSCASRPEATLSQWMATEVV